MKKFLCFILCLITVFSLTSCLPPRRETEEEKRIKQLIAEDMAKLDAIIEKNKEAETMEETIAD